MRGLLGNGWEDFTTKGAKDAKKKGEPRIGRPTVNASDAREPDPRLSLSGYLLFVFFVPFVVKTVLAPITVSDGISSRRCRRCPRGARARPRPPPARCRHRPTAPGDGKGDRRSRRPARCNCPARR